MASDAVIISGFSALSVILVAAFGLLGQWLNARATRKGIAVAEETKVEVVALKENNDGKLNQLIAAKVGEADAKGQMQGQADERAHQAETAALPTPLAAANQADDPVKVRVVKPDLKPM